MKSWLLIICFLLGVLHRAPAQATLDADALLRGVEAWAQDNLDDRVLGAFKDVDRDQLRQWMEELKRRMAGENVYDLAVLQTNALKLLPLLEEYEESYPYAIWLRTHLDYFDTAGRLQRESRRGLATNAPTPAPTITLERSIWQQQLRDRKPPTEAERYARQLKPIFAAEKVPAELVWVAEVESSFEPSARSPAGAVGMFQLMPVTARSLGLSTSPRDQRLDPERSARAAARYLRRLHQRFGDWRLALAAYNAGETRVNDLLQRSKTRSYDAIARKLPAETQMYVPKVEATVRRRENRDLATLKVPRA